MRPLKLRKNIEVLNTANEYKSQTQTKEKD